MDRPILFTAAFLRAVCVGMTGVILALYLAASGFNTSEIGLAIAIGLSGGVVATILVSRYSDHFGRRRSQVLLGLFATVGGLGLVWSQSFASLAFVIFVGMINGKGGERGAVHAIDQSLLPQLTDDCSRTRSFAWYNMFLDAGHAVGALLGAIPVLIEQSFLLNMHDSYRLTFCIYSAIMLTAALLPLALSSQVESKVRHDTTSVRLSPITRRRLIGLSSLFSLDSLGGGLLTSALISYWFFMRFQIGLESLGLLFFAARITNALSHFAAAWLASRIGLIKTMVFTHVPSSLLLIAVAFAPTFSVAVVLFLVRELLVKMDVPTRQSYVMAIVQPVERTAVAGITTLVRNVGWMFGSALAGLLMSESALSTPLYAGAGLKLLYDGLLFKAFKGVSTPEENA